MLQVKVEESKHKLEDIINNQGASPTTVRLFEDFLNEVAANLEQQGKNPSFRTHKIDVSDFSRQGKGFMFVNLRQNQVSVLYFTGKSNIPGLEKRNWLNKDDNMGRETFKITDDATLKKAVGFALAAWDLAS